MISRRLQLAGVVLLGVLARLSVFYNVGVNGDTGLYLYDAKQILWGRQLLVEFPSRSPVMEYLLAGVLSVNHSPIVSARLFMVGVAVVLGVLIYIFARQLHSHRAGLAASGLFFLTPFSVVWGLWVKTEQVAAVFLLTGLLVALFVIDKDELPVWAIAAVGTSFGLAFLVRRVAIVHIGAFALFFAWYRYRYHEESITTVSASVGVFATAMATLFAAYFVLADFDPALTLAIADHHSVALFKSGGQGSLGWVELTKPRAITAESGDTILSKVCQKCGANTVAVFLSTLLVAIPGVLPLFIFLRSYLEPAGFTGDVVLPVAFIVAGLFGLIQLIGTPYLGRAFFAAVVVLTVALLWYLDPIEFDELWSPELALPVLILVGLTAGYLYRDRILYVTYFQDFYPYVVTLSGISAVAFYDRYRSRRTVMIVAALLLVSAGAVGAANAYPYNPDRGDDNRKWFSIELVQEHGSDIESRTDPGDRILAAQPLYVIEADRRLAGDLSRRYYLFRGWPNTSLAESTDRGLAQSVEAGDVTLVVEDKELRNVYDRTRHIEPAVRGGFEPAPYGQSLYNRTNATLYDRVNE